MKRPSSHTIEVIRTWVGVVLLFVLLWKFPGLGHWLFSPFRDHLSAHG
jgi:hypothetical protein